MLPRHLAAMLLCQFLWGINFVASRIALQSFEPVFFVSLRFSMVAVLLVFVVGLPPRRLLAKLLPLSVTLGAMHFTLINLGMKNLDAGVSSIAVQLQTPFAAILAHFFLSERLGWRRILGMLTAFAGVLLIAGEPRFSANPVPLLSVIAAALVWAAGNIQVKKLGDEVDAVQLNGWIAILAAPQLIAVSLALEGPQLGNLGSVTWESWGALIYQGIVIAIFSYMIWYNMMQRYPVKQVMPFTLLLPAVGVGAGALILNEPVSWQMVVGGLATVAGVGIIVIRRPAVVAPATKTGI
jgi:O-acetylserine/cysteine efflux transporter